MTRYRTNGEMRTSPIKDKKLIQISVSGKCEKILRKEAIENDTSVAEIIRTLIDEHVKNLKPSDDNADNSGIFYRIYYGIKSFDSKGIEKPYDEYTTGKLYETFDEAAADQKVWFDGQVEEMRSHHPRRRKSEQAFSYIDVVRLDDDNPDGMNIYDELDDVMIKKIDETYLTMNGSDL